MLQRTTKLLIGKDIARSALVTAATTFPLLILSTTLLSGEIVVLDKNKIPLAAGKTIADSDIIFICQGTSATYTYTQPGGSVITARQINISDPIEGAKVKHYTGTAYDAKSEQTIVFTPSAVPAIGDEMILRIEYKDMPEHPGQFTQTYRFICTAASVANAITGLVAKINSHTGRRVNATDGTTTLTLTGREIADGATGLTDLDAFSMVEFDAQLTTITAASTTKIPAAWTQTSKVVTPAEYGSGNWEQVRDLEQSVVGNRGVYNKIYFPVKTPVQDTVVDTAYDLLVIEHDRSYLSPDNQYIKQAPLTTIVAFPLQGLHTDNVLAVLNPWMASTPGAFAAVSF